MALDSGMTHFRRAQSVATPWHAMSPPAPHPSPTIPWGGWRLKGNLFSLCLVHFCVLPGAKHRSGPTEAPTWGHFMVYKQSCRDPNLGVGGSRASGPFLARGWSEWGSPMSSLFSSGGQSIGALASASVFPMNIWNEWEISFQWRTSRKSTLGFLNRADELLVMQHIDVQRVLMKRRASVGHHHENEGLRGLRAILSNWQHHLSLRVPRFGYRQQRHIEVCSQAASSS